MYQNNVFVQQERGSLIRFDTLFGTVLIRFDSVCIKSSFDSAAEKPAGGFQILQGAEHCHLASPAHTESVY